MRGGRGFRDNKPIGVTKSMLAARHELQNYGIKDNKFLQSETKNSFQRRN
jgi:hypothetical protein